METWSGLPTEGTPIHSAGGDDAAAVTEAGDRQGRSTEDYDEFERQTREGVRVLDEMSDEDDGGAMDEAGGCRAPHKDVHTVTLETLGSSYVRESVKEHMNKSLPVGTSQFLELEKSKIMPPPPPSAQDSHSDWGRDEKGAGFPQQYHTIRANRKRVCLPTALGPIGGFERRGGGGGAGPWFRYRQ
jgi:hypothetical protein